MNSNSATSSQTRVVKHALGEVTIPAKPLKVVTLNPEYADYMIALGVKPVGQSSEAQIGGFLPYLNKQLEGVKDVGSPSQGNFEAILSLAPDLIIGADYLKDHYEQLSKIAPTVLVGGDDIASKGADRWKAQLQKFGEVLGKQNEAAALLKNYEKKVQDAKVKLAKASNESVAFLRIRPKGVQIYAEAPHPLMNLIYGELGLKPTPLTPKDGNSADLSLEKLPELKADHVYLQVDGNAREYMKELEKHPIWKTVPAVSSNKVYAPDFWVYMSWGTIGRSLIIDEIVKNLAGGTSTGAASQSSAERTFTHKLGQTKLPVNPRKVVDLSYSADFLVALGVVPIASPSDSDGKSFYPYLASRLAGTTPIASALNPNLEQLLMLQPDLIIAREGAHDQHYEALSKIAPTVMVSVINTDKAYTWKEHLHVFANIFNQQASAKETIVKYEARTAQLKSKLANKVGDRTILMPRVNPKDTIQIFGTKGHGLGDLFHQELGLKAAVGVPDAHSVQLSEEKFYELDPDYMFIMASNKDAKDRLEQLKEKPLWKNMKAIKNNHIYDASNWIPMSWGPVGLNAIMDELEKIFAIQ